MGKKLQSNIQTVVKDLLQNKKSELMLMGRATALV